MSNEHTNRRIRDFLSPRFQGHQLRDDDDIFSLGFVNSLFAMQLVLFVEKQLGVPLEGDDLQMENFRSIDAIVRLVEAKSAKVVP